MKILGVVRLFYKPGCSLLATGPAQGVKLAWFRKGGNMNNLDHNLIREQNESQQRGHRRRRFGGLRY